MEVVLLEDVKALGKKGQIVKVSDGYGRNFILTKKLGIEATPKNLNDLKLQKANENGGYYVINANAKYNNTAEQYLEYYNGFTTYSYKSSSDAAYVFYFYLIDEGTPSIHVRADESVTENVAQWSGTADYKTAGVTADTGIAGDSLNANDLLDTDAVYSAVVNGVAVAPYTEATSTSTGSTSYYMGGKGIGSGLVQDWLVIERDEAAKFQLWVREDNPSALRMYEASGFLPDGRIAPVMMKK